MTLRWSAVFAVLALLLQWIAPPALAQVLQTWQGMGLSMLAVLSAVWFLGTVLRNHSLMDIAYPLAPWLVTMIAWWQAGAERLPTTLVLLTALGLWAWRLPLMPAYRVWMFWCWTTTRPCRSARGRFAMPSALSKLWTVWVSQNKPVTWA